MFDRLAASLNIAFKWLPMLDLDQTFWFMVQIVWSFSHLCTQSKPKREKATNQKQNLRDIAA